MIKSPHHGNTPCVGKQVPITNHKC